jgi:hypothetical protein
MTLTESERQKLAEKLAKLDYKKARKEVRKLDKAADLKIWRNGVGPGELHTTYDLPTLGIRVTLVEKAERREADGGAKIKPKYLYTEARVEPLSAV